MNITEKFYEINNQKNVKNCICQQKENCPMTGACLQESLVSYATISCNDKNYKPKIYKGSCEASSKKRYSNHKISFNVPLYKDKSKLSTLKIVKLFT